MADPGESRAKQSMKDECDINNILRQYQKTGVLNHTRENAGQYVDLPNVPDYQEALNIVIAAGEAFEQMPGSLRQRFGNSAEEFLNFMDDDGNIDESVELGLREPVEIEPDPQMDIEDVIKEKDPVSDPLAKGEGQK